MSNSALPPQDKEMTLVQHLLDLKTSLTRSILAILVLFLFLFPFANDIYVYISEPLTRFMSSDTSMIATGVASPFLTPFKLSLVLAIYLAMPFLLFQLWRFIAPALYKHERQLVAPLLFFSSFLFYAGGAFAYYVVFPLVFGFLSTTAPEGVTIATDIAAYLDFVIKMFFAFGMAFEVPIVTVLLILSGMASPEKLSHARPYIIVGAFVIGMLLTPPDIISQTLLAIPMWLLYEIGVIVGAMVLKRRKPNEEGTSDEFDEYEDYDESFDSAPVTSNSAQTEKQKATSSGQSDNKTNKTAKASSDTNEIEFDDRYADQAEDDFDWDSEFEKIDSEMSILEQEYKKRQESEKDKKGDDSQKPEADKPTADEQPADANTASKADDNKPESK